MSHDQRPTTPLTPELLRLATEHRTPHTERTPVPQRRRADTVAAELPPPLDRHPNQRLPCLTAMRGQLPGRLYVLKPGVTALGRGVANDITLNDSGVSRCHAQLEVSDDHVELVDLGSSNGTFINGRRVEIARLDDRTKFSLGTRVTLRLDWLDADDRAFQQKQFESLTRDALTQCHNRTYLDEEFLRAASIAHRSRKPLSAMVLDLDHFKHVNDRWGHAMGDAVLRAVAQALRDTVRGDDVLARVGGEEFVLLMPETDLETATAIAERVRSSVKATQLAAPGESVVAVTVSVGVASLREADPVDPEALLALADARMFLAKDRGRDQVVSTGGLAKSDAVWRMGTDRSSRSLTALPQRKSKPRRRRTTVDDRTKRPSGEPLTDPSPNPTAAPADDPAT